MCGGFCFLLVAFFIVSCKEKMNVIAEQSCVGQEQIIRTDSMIDIGVPRDPECSGAKAVYINNERKGLTMASPSNFESSFFTFMFTYTKEGVSNHYEKIFIL